MAIFTSIIEKALRDTSRKGKIHESAGFEAEDEMDDVSLEDMFQDDNETDTNLDDRGQDFFELESDEGVTNVTFDEEKAKEDKGDSWYVELKKPIEDFLKDSSAPVLLKGDVEIDKPALETALAELFTSLGISPFSGNVIEDGSIKVAAKEAGEDSFAEEDLKQVDGVEDAVMESAEEAFEKEADSSLMPMNDAAGDEAEIVSLNIEWDGTSVGIGDMDVEYADAKEEPAEETEEEPADDEEDDEEEADDEAEDEDEMNETFSAEKILALQDEIDNWDVDSIISEAELSDGGAKDEEVKDPNPSMKPGTYHFNNGGDDSNFVDGVEDLSMKDDSTDASEPAKSGEFFRGNFEGEEPPEEQKDSTDVSKPKLNDFLPNTEEIISALEKETIRESADFNNGGKQVDVGDDLVMSEINPDTGDKPEEFVWDSEFVDTDGDMADVALSHFRDGEDTPLTDKHGDMEREFLSAEDELRKDGLEKRQGE